MDRTAGALLTDPDMTAHNHTPFRAYVFLMLVYSFLWATLTAADHYTTLLGLEMGYRELNPFTDFSSIETLVLPEIMIWVVGGILISAGCALHPAALNQPLPEIEEFRRSLFPNRIDASALIVIPIAIALGRTIPVMNNICLIAFDFAIASNARALLSVFGLSASATGPILGALIVFLMYRPVCRIVYIINKKAAGSSPAKHPR